MRESVHELNLGEHLSTELAVFVHLEHQHLTRGLVCHLQRGERAHNTSRGGRGRGREREREREGERERGREREGGREGEKVRGTNIMLFW